MSKKNNKKGLWITGENCYSCGNGFKNSSGKIFCQLKCKNVRPDENCPEWEEKNGN